MDRARHLSLNQKLNSLHATLVRTGDLSDADFWACVDQFETSVAACTHNAGKPNGFTDAKLDVPENEISRDPFAKEVFVKCYLPESFCDRVFVRHPHIHLAFKSAVPKHMSHETFWREYCRWINKLPVDPDLKAFVNFDDCVNAESLGKPELAGSRFDSILDQVPECNLTRYKDPVWPVGKPLPAGYGGLNLVALGEGKTQKQCQKSLFKPFELLGDMESDGFVTRLNRHGSIVVEQSSTAKGSVETLAASLSDPPRIDVSTHDMKGRAQGHDMCFKSHPTNSIPKMNKRQKVDLSMWSPAIEQAAPEPHSAKRVLSHFASGLAAQKVVLDSTEHAKGSAVGDRYRTLEKLLSWFWKLCPAQWEEAKILRKTVMSQVESRFQKLQNTEEKSTHHDSMLIHLSEMIENAKKANSCLIALAIDKT